VLVLEKLLALSLQHDAACLQHVAAMSEFQGVVHILLHQEDGDSLLVDLLDGMVQR